MAETRLAIVLAAVVMTLTISGCGAGSIGDSLPAGVGLPAGTPPRPASPYQFPAVHDMPPQRSTKPLNDQEQLNLQNELKGVRDKQNSEALGNPDQKAAVPVQPQVAKSPTAQQGAPPPKKKPADVILVPPAGASAKP